MKKIKYPKTTKNNVNNFKKYKKKRNYNQLEKQSKKISIIKEKNSITDKFKEIKAQFEKSFFKIEKKRRFSLDKLIKKFDSLRITEKLLNEKSTSLIYKDNKIIKDNNKKLNKYKININKNYGTDITGQVEIIKDTIKNNIPFQIKFGNYNYYIDGKNPENNLRVTWHCPYYRRVKNKPNEYNKFCNSTIRGIRKTNINGNFIYYLEKDHSIICKELIKTIVDTDKNNKNMIIQYNKLNKDSGNNGESENIKKNKTDFDKVNNIRFYTKKEYYSILEDYIKDNKSKNISCSDFITFGFRIYNNNKSNTIKDSGVLSLGNSSNL